jgi:hypothetical protein
VHPHSIEDEATASKPSAPSLLDECKEVGRELVVARCNPATVLDLIEEALDQIPIQLDQEQAIAVRGLDATAHPPPQHDQLMSERRVLCLKSALRLER